MSPSLHLLPLARAFFLVLALRASAAAPSAQCPVPDGLDGNPCCTLVTETVPHFPRVAQASVAICFADCDVEATHDVTAVWTPLKVQPSEGADCGYRLTRLELVNPSGATTWTGVLRQLYARTWLETTPTGATLQVWRFLVNGDLRSTSVIPLTPCPAPSCAPAFGNRVHYSGYIDYAQECGVAGPVTQVAWMLSHPCDRFTHLNGSARAGVFHPDRSYSLVGPSTDFQPSAVGPVELFTTRAVEGVRRLRYPPAGTSGPILCEAEESATARLAVLSQNCTCFDTLPVFAQFYTAEESVSGNCGTVLSQSGGPLLPGYVSMSVGLWNNPAVFPGVEIVRWSITDIRDSDPCALQQTRKIFHGISTFSGYPPTELLSTGPGGPLPDNFIDQASAVDRSGAMLVNVPSLSDQLIHLNW